MFNQGDRVELHTITGGSNVFPEGALGTVIVPSLPDGSYAGWVGVEFDEEFASAFGHNLDGLIESHRGRYIRPQDLILIEADEINYDNLDGLISLFV